MAEFPALPLWTDAYLSDTTHLSTFEHGAYMLLLMVSWRSPGCCAPDDDAMLAKYTRMTLDKWRKVRPILAPFFNIRGGFWHQARLQDEFRHLQTQRENQSKAGKASAAAKALKRTNRGSTNVGDPLERNVNRITTPTPTPTTVDKSTVRAARAAPEKPSAGARLSTDWSLPDDWRQWTIDELGWAADHVIAEAKIFRDYWIGKPGKEGRKSDWFATWRNWCRNSFRQPGGGSRAKPAGKYEVENDAELSRRLRIEEYARMDGPTKDLRS